MKKSLLLGTRGSRLAKIQAEEVRNMLASEFPGLKVGLKVIKTEGDIDRISPLSGFGGRGAFVKSIESALLREEIDAAVHSLKDLPSKMPEERCIGAVPVREDPRDVLLTRNGCELISLPPGSVVGTGSERRSTQLMDIRPDIICKNIRGNVETRLRKVNDGVFDAIVLAAAGLKRLGLLSHASQFIDTDAVLPAPCQGAIGVECRADDSETLKLLEGINNPDVRVCVDAERIFIATLGMGCHTPVGALAELDGENIIFSAYAKNFENGELLRRTIRSPGTEIKEAVCELAKEFRAEIY